MRKHLLLFLALASSFALQAQWVDNPATNTFIANCSNDASEVYTATDPVSGDTYVQWNSFGSNGWSPTLQRLTFDGTPQWGDAGIHIGGHEFSSMSEGVAMTATTDGCVVSCFANYDGNTYAVKINPNGNFVWGEQGLQLFGGLGFSRTELTAGNDGGFWALGFDYENLYLQYVGADGTMGPTTTISESGGYKCMFGQLSISNDNNVLLTYEKVGTGFYTDKEVYVIGVTPDGVIIGPAVLLMSSRTFQSTYIHHAVPDGSGGGYAYIWHPGIEQAFNTYVFHFDSDGLNTLDDLDGVPVHSSDPSNFYLDAYGTVDPLSHDLIIAYEQTDASTQTQSRIYVNRIDDKGERIWGEGILVADYVGDTYSNVLVDTYEDGSGFCVIYNKGGYISTVEAKGYDMNGNLIWTKQVSSSSYARAMCENSTGFHLGQNVIAWVNSSNGGMYAQNIGPDGTMGYIEPIIPCLAPEYFTGEYVYDDETQTFGAKLTWTAPETRPLHYNLYITDPVACTTTVEIDPSETEYSDETTVIGTIKYQLTAIYENCESDFALTLDGLDYLQIEITGVEENADNNIVNVLNVYNMSGQRVSIGSIDELGTGVYILQGLTEDGRLVSHKVMVDKK